ncbi:MAG: type 2 lanthipeptide synthetase LanM family protein [Acidobacteriota bacterium]|nr:type 2 lanthipeptide synthetase LanM family protein [Acidobacteriota bacterium]
MTAKPFHTPNYFLALNLEERTPLDRPPAVRDIDEARGEARLNKWRATRPFEDKEILAARLADDGLDEAGFRTLLGESAESLAARAGEMPSWMTRFAGAYAPDAGLPEPPDPDLDRFGATGGFFNLVRPLYAMGYHELQAGIDALARAHDDLPFNPKSIARTMSLFLPRPMLNAMTRTLIHEINVARLRQELSGETGEERFACFVASLERTDVRARLFAEYPVLARNLLRMVDYWKRACLEFLTHLSRDWADIQTTFFDGQSPGPLAELTMGEGDTHRGGRTVISLRFQSDDRLIYKPRSLAVERHFQKLLTWLNARSDLPDFRPLVVLDREDRGWVEFAEHKGCDTTEQLTRFYLRQGAYLALLYALEANDFHSENLIASGEHPVLVDLESLFQPRLLEDIPAEKRRGIGYFIAFSVLRIGMLPRQSKQEDYDGSGLGHTRQQLSPVPIVRWDNEGTDEMKVVRKRIPLKARENLPRLGKEPIRVLDYSDQIESGFVRMYQCLIDQREALLGPNSPLAAFAEDEVRVILRPTNVYTRMLVEATHPILLRDALDRERFLDRLWLGTLKNKTISHLVAHEKRDLACNDVPLFTTRPGSRDLFSAPGVPVSDFLECCPMDAVRARIEAMDARDMEWQRRLIRGSLTALGMGEGHLSWGSYEPVADPPATTHETLAAAAQRIGDRLVDLAFVDGDKADWMCLNMVGDRHWSLRPADWDFYNGLPGIILFLAYLGQIAGEVSYTDLAHRGLESLRDRIPTEEVDEVPLLGLSGLGGVIYCYSHLGALWQDAGLSAEAKTLAEALPEHLDSCPADDVIGGAAGAIMALLALHRLTESERLLDIARLCADHLLTQARPMERGLGWCEEGGLALGGFSHGSSGYALVLLALADACDHAPYAEAAHEALRYERTLFSESRANWYDLREKKSFQEAVDKQSFMTAWCHGAPGIGLARLAMLPFLDTPETRAELAVALTTTRHQGFGGNHSLCHGDLGNLELLFEAGRVLDDAELQSQVEHITAVILASSEEHGWMCGVPMGVETPGFMTGLAGIGYQLLRLTHPDQLPSVLSLAAPRVLQAVVA